MNNKYLVIAVVLILAIVGISWYVGTKEDSMPAPINNGSNNSQNNTQNFSINDSVWVWKETQMNNGTIVKPKKPGVFTLTFTEQGNVSGNTDCNNFGGTYTAGANRTLSFGPFMSTLMFCEGSQEAQFSKMVSDSTSFTFNAQGDLILLIKFDSGSVIFTKK